MEISDFLEKYPVTKSNGSFSEGELDKLKDIFPDTLIDFLSEYGRTDFLNGFFSTIGPFEINSKLLFDSWGFNGEECYLFMRNCFGPCLFVQNKEIYLLNTFDATFQNLGDDIVEILDIFFIGSAYGNGTFKYDYFMSKKSNLPGIERDEVYMFLPALPMGGSLETSKLEPGKMVEHLCFLAQLNDNSAEEY